MQFAGVVAPACHGTGRFERTVSDLIVKVEFFSIKNGQVEPFVVSEKENSQYLKAAKANFGLFGMMYAITIEVEPLERIKVTNTTDTTSKYLDKDSDELEKLVRNNFAVEIFWLPFNVN